MVIKIEFTPHPDCNIFKGFKKLPSLEKGDTWAEESNDRREEVTISAVTS